MRTLAVGTVHACVLGEDDGVYCFGTAVSGGWGTGEHPSCEKPCPQYDFRKAHFVKTLGHSVRELGVGGGYACALKHDGTVWCWGANQGHVVAESETIFTVDRTNYVVESLPRQRVEVGSDNRHLMTAMGHACVEKNDGSLWCWGSNASRQFFPSIERSVAPRRVELPAPRCPSDARP